MPCCTPWKRGLMADTRATPATRPCPGGVRPEPPASAGTCQCCFPHACAAASAYGVPDEYPTTQTLSSLRCLQKSPNSSAKSVMGWGGCGWEPSAWCADEGGCPAEWTEADASCRAAAASAAATVGREPLWLGRLVLLPVALVLKEVTEVKAAAPGAEERPMPGRSMTISRTSAGKLSAAAAAARGLNLRHPGVPGMKTMVFGTTS
mmetsp:Transcript_4068/g.10153  ORF Transcript_4068/g.10153 Transcript_4068/m.10153 type:complete len:206 (-) Transcript_4068:210-827(-)